MKKSTLLYVATSVAFLVFVFTVLNTKNSDTMSKPEASNTMVNEPNTVLINDFKFGPSKLVVKKGTTITWKNVDGAHHDIAPTSGANDFRGSEKLLAKNESYSFTFNNTGIYNYKCSPHPYMKGTVEVTE